MERRAYLQPATLQIVIKIIYTSRQSQKYSSKSLF